MLVGLRRYPHLAIFLSAIACVCATAAEPSATFTPLEEVQTKIVGSSVAFPGGRYEATNLIDGNVRTEYSSAGKGTGTFVDFDFGRPRPIAGFHHRDRADGINKIVFI